jgi:hypothetical protein
MKKISVTIENRSSFLVVSSEVESICKALSSGRVIEVKICAVLVFVFRSAVGRPSYSE